MNEMRKNVAACSAISKIKIQNCARSWCHCVYLHCHRLNISNILEALRSILLQIGEIAISHKCCSRAKNILQKELAESRSLSN